MVTKSAVWILKIITVIREPKMTNTGYCKNDVIGLMMINILESPTEIKTRELMRISNMLLAKISRWNSLK